MSGSMPIMSTTGIAGRITLPPSGMSLIGILPPRITQAEGFCDRARGVCWRPFCLPCRIPAVAGRGIKSHHAARLLQCQPAFSTLCALRQREEGTMKNPLDSLWGTVIAGFVLTVILYYIVKSLIGG